MDTNLIELNENAGLSFMILIFVFGCAWSHVGQADLANLVLLWWHIVSTLLLVITFVWQQSLVLVH